MCEEVYIRESFSLVEVLCSLISIEDFKEIYNILLIQDWKVVRLLVVDI